MERFMMRLNSRNYKFVFNKCNNKLFYFVIWFFEIQQKRKNFSDFTKNFKFIKFMNFNIHTQSIT